jgi:hypothetical protein
MIAAEKPRARSSSRSRKVIAIESAAYVAPYRLRLRFDDGRENLVDFGPFLTASAHPSIRAYLDKARFKQFTVEDGFLHWNDFELVFPMADLYAGTIR